MERGSYNKIKEVLESKGIKQTWIAEQLGITFRQFNSYANNKMQPSIPTLYRIASILDCKVQDLLIDNQ